MTHNPINVSKIIIGYTTHTNKYTNTFPEIQHFHTFHNSIFFQTNQKGQRFMLIFIALFILCIICIFLYIFDEALGLLGGGKGR